MPILSMPPSPAFARSRFRLLSNTQTFVSPLDRSVQTLELPGARWAAEFTLPPMKRAQAAAWLAFLAQCRGGAGRFYAGDPDGRAPRGVATGAPQVDGASQVGTNLATKGWTASVAGILKAGDYVAFDAGAGRELHIVAADAASDNAGKAVLAIEPPIRASPANNAALFVAAAACVMRLADDGQAAWDVDQLGVFGITFAAIESFL
jgi:hypothetical protein